MQKNLVNCFSVLIILFWTCHLFAQEGNMATTYDSLWQKIQQYEAEALPQSALKVVDTILTRAKKEQNQPQIIKALLKEIELRNAFEEASLVSAIRKLEAEIEHNPFPAKAILQSVLAQTYQAYYQQNRHKIIDRTTLNSPENSDIETWDAHRFHVKILELARSSLEESDRLKAIPIDQFEAILKRGKDSARFRPTLYDFLAFTAVEMFSNTELRITLPKDHFRLTAPEALAPSQTFINFRFTSPDPLSYDFQALKIFQELVRFHLNDAQPDALIDAELHRYKFVNSIAKIADKDSLYLTGLEHLAKTYENHPASALAAYEVARYYFQRSEKYQRLLPEEGQNLVYKNDRKRALDICESVIRKFGDHPDTKNCKALSKQIKTRQIQLSVEEVNYPNQPFRGSVNFRNISKIFVRVASVTPEALEQHKQSKKHIDFDDQLNFFKAQPVAAEFTVELPDDGDLHNHITEIKFPELPPGQYAVLVGTNPQFTIENAAAAFKIIWVSKIAYIMRYHPHSDGTGVYVMDRETGEPLQNATIQTWVNDYDRNTREYGRLKSRRFTTDKHGYALLPPNSNRRSSQVLLDIAHNGDRLFLDQSHQVSSPQQQPVREPRKMVQFFTDRSIYRPGQTVYFKGIMMLATPDDSKILPDQEVAVELRDVNHTVLSTLKLTTNEYGTFNGSFVIPTGVLTGRMYLTSPFGRAEIFVEEYKRPTFEVSFQPIKGSYRLGETVTVNGTAKAYAGTPISGAQVRYNIVRKISFRYFWTKWWMPIPDEEYVVDNGTTQTDVNGNFTIEFPATGDDNISENQQLIYNFSVTADVVDLSGETRSAATDIRIGTVAVQVSLNLPEEINLDKPVAATVSSENLSGEFEPVSGKVTVYSLQGPERILRNRFWEQPDRFLLDKATFVKLFPHDVYAGEDDFRNWEKGEMVAQKSFDTAQSDTIRFENAKDWAQGKYLIELTAKDKFGTDIKIQRYVTAYSLQNRNIPNHVLSWFTPLQSMAKPGEIAQIYWGSAASNVHAILEINRPAHQPEIQFVKNGGKKEVLLLPVHQSDVGGIWGTILFVKYGRAHQFSQFINVPDSDKTLQITYETFRDKLKPGAKEEWRLNISGADGEAVAAELLAAMYDASLDAFKPHQWNFMRPNALQRPAGSRFQFQSLTGYEVLFARGNGWNPSVSFWHPEYDRLDFELPMYPHYRGMHNRMEIMTMRAAPVSDAAAEETSAQDKNFFEKIMGSGAQQEPPAPPTPPASFDDVPIRRNLNETAFFYPELRTDENGSVIIAFTMPEALTRWKFLGFAHTRDLRYGLTEKEVVTQKELMVTPNAPRFFRAGDRIVFTGKVSNMSDSTLDGSVVLHLFDAETMQPLPALFADSQTTRDFHLEKAQSAAFSWTLNIPEALNAVTYRLIAKTTRFSDGEENLLPVLTNRMLVTESLPISIRGNTQKHFEFQNLLDSGKSSTLSHERLVLEFSTNPIWYAVQALPYLMEFPYECSEQVASRFYANSLAAHIVSQTPRIKRLFDNWKATSPEAFYSNLQKNPELKSVILEETPWVLEAASESESKRRIALLFDLNRMAHENHNALNRLKKMQLPNGAWPWFEGMRENRYITTHILTMLGQLQKFGAITPELYPELPEIVSGAILYLQNYLHESYQELLEEKVDLKQRHLSREIVHILYALSYFRNENKTGGFEQAYAFWLSQAETYWTDNDKFSQGMIALALHRQGNLKTPPKILNSLREHALQSEEFGMYWRKEWGYFWYEAPIELQSLMIEAFGEISNDPQLIEEMRIWLLKQKQTTHWQTTKATAAACYALLYGNPALEVDDDEVEITLGDLKISSETVKNIQEPGTGYFKKTWQGSEIQPQMGNISVKKEGEGIAWGAVYWQYFETLDAIPQHQTGLQIHKSVYRQQDTPDGTVLVPISEATPLKTGDLITIRIELRTDRDLEYVHMKDMRAAGLEPLNVLSQTKYQDGLVYYESTRDAATHFFFDYLPKGTYVFEYSLRAFHAGDFSNGITTIQCMYAPEFTSHTQGIRIRIK
jgi:uncharacterized protein YfaS (alpha-2-macroglobulin family)